jgi:hypothetical protein
MGCTGARETLCEEEKAITKGEQLLGFNKCKTKVLIEQFKKYSRGELINKNAFALAAASAKLNTEGYEDDKTAKGKFYASFGNEFVFPE